MNWQWKLAQYTEIRWWKYYLKGKDIETYLVQKKAYWRSILKQLGLNLSSNDRLLDAGCGPAGIFMIFEEQEVVAIDPLLDHYQASIDHFSPDWYPNVQFINQKIEDISFEEKFEIIFCLNAINHVDRLEWAIRHLVSALKPGGKLILSSDVHKYQLLKYLFRWIPLDILHPHQYSMKDYVALIEQNYCKIEAEILSKPGKIFDYRFIIATKMD